jgi:hypothetical protein
MDGGGPKGHELIFHQFFSLLMGTFFITPNPQF